LLEIIQANAPTGLLYPSSHPRKSGWEFDFAIRHMREQEI